MLSTSSFNALLKTLEEPPPHVKFLLATTDPQKLPVTVLSRCLQFNLKNMSREHIVQHLKHILSVEQVMSDEPSLWAIAEGAQGSMRDALSLTDQAIAFGQGALKEQDVAAMLGTVDLKRVLKFTHALLEKNADKLMALVAEVDEHAPDYRTLMTELMSTLHRVAIAQAVPDAISNHKGDRDAILTLAQAAYAEDVQLYYQIAGKAKPEMSLAPSERAGFEMALLRMLAFSQTPAQAIDELPPLSGLPATEPAPVAVETDRDVSPSGPQTRSAGDIAETVAPLDVAATEEASGVPWATADDTPVKAEPAQAPVAAAAPVSDPGPVAAPVAEPQPEPTATPTRSETGTAADTVAEAQSEPDAPADTTTDSEPVTAAEQPALSNDEATWPETDLDADPQFWWQVTLHRLGLSGMTKTLFAHSQWESFSDGVLRLVISPNYRKIMNDSHQGYLLQAIQSWLPECRKLSYEFGAVDKTPQLWLDQMVQQANDRAYRYLQVDPFVQTLVNDFNGQLVQTSAVPNNSPIPSGA